MKLRKKINSTADIKNREGKAEQSVCSKVSIFGCPLEKCFICDEIIVKAGISLMLGCVPYSKTGLPKKIGELMGDGFMVIINENDLLCRRCVSMLNRVDKLEQDLDITKNTLTSYLRIKYNLISSEETDLSVSPTGNTPGLDEVTESSPFNASVFLQSTEDTIESAYSDNGIPESGIQQVNDEENVVRSEKPDFENDCGGDPCGGQTSDSPELAESMETVGETMQLEAEEHLNDLQAFSTKETEDVNCTPKQTLYQCDNCTFQSISKEFLEKHKQKHFTNCIYQCSLCGKRFKSRPYLLRHMNCHIIFKCEICSLTFQEKKMLLDHMVVHKQDESSPEQNLTETEHFEPRKDISSDIISKGQQYEIQTNIHSLDIGQKEYDIQLKAVETVMKNTVHNSNMQADDPYVLHGKEMDLNKLEELIGKLHADEVSCTNIEELSKVSVHGQCIKPTATHECQKAEESISSTNNENHSKSLTQVEVSEICRILVSPNMLIQHENETDKIDSDKADILKLFNNESINLLENCDKDQISEPAAKWRIFVCSECGLKYQSASEMKEHLMKHIALDNRTFECNICKRIFTSFIYLKRHLVNHEHFSQKVTCNLCSEEVADKLHLREHMKEIHAVSMYCLYCNQEFTSKRELKQHERAHPEYATYRCSQCNKRFRTEIKLKIHLRKVHNNAVRDVFKCNICSKNLATMYSLRRHMINHQNSTKNAKCQICSEVLTDKLHLQQHIEHLHADVYQCPFCYKTFSNRRQCKNHELAHPERYIYKCDICTLRFKDQTGLEKHNSVYHRDPHCNFCGKEISDPIKLLKHERRHENKFPCKECSKVFQTPSGLKYHMAKHTGKYSVYCEICGKGMHSETFLEEHKAAHTKEPRYTCDVCGRSFASKSTYGIHRRWHDNPLPYRCKYCKRKFKHSSILAVHIRSAHTGERPYKCPHCPLAFNVSYTLQKHVILHTKNYPFICKYCNKGFTTRSKIAWHLSKVHSDFEMMNSKHSICEYKMALKPSEMPSAADDDPSLEQQPLEEAVVEEHVVDAEQTIFLFQGGFSL